MCNDVVIGVQNLFDVESDSDSSEEEVCRLAFFEGETPLPAFPDRWALGFGAPRTWRDRNRTDIWRDLGDFAIFPIFSASR